MSASEERRPASSPEIARAEDPRLAGLTPDEQAVIVADERDWRRAHDFVAKHPSLDVGDVFHTIRQLRRTPAERLALGLRHGRLTPHRR